MIATRAATFVRATALALAFALLLGVAASAGAQGKNVKKPAAPVKVEPSPVPGNLNGMAIAAAQAGVRKCLPRIDQVTTFLATGAQSGAMLFAPPQDPDRGLSSFSLEVLAPNALSYATANFTPTPQGCTASYESVTYWESTCAQVARAIFANFRPGGALRQFISVLDGGPQTKVFLMPAGNNCVSIKKEILY
jgi:hypothetical protein